MNIYLLWRDADGFGLNACVVAEDEEAAKKEVGWEIDDFTKEITVKKVGWASTPKKRILAEEML